MDPSSGFQSGSVECRYVSTVSESFVCLTVGSYRAGVCLCALLGRSQRIFGFAACPSNRVIKGSTKNNLAYRTTQSLAQIKKKNNKSAGATHEDMQKEPYRGFHAAGTRLKVQFANQDTKFVHLVSLTPTART